MLSEDERWEQWNAQGVDEMSQKEADAFARAIEAAVLEKLKQQEPVASLTISNFRGHMTNHDIDYFGDLPEGSYSLYTSSPQPIPPVRQVGINGLTEAETDASASVAGLTAPVQQDDEYRCGGPDCDGKCCKPVQQEKQK